MKRYFEFIEGSSSKFWEISVSDKIVTVRFGRIGTNGQTQREDAGRRRGRDQARRETHQGEDRQGLQGDCRPLSGYLSVKQYKGRQGRWCGRHVAGRRPKPGTV